MVLVTLNWMFFWFPILNSTSDSDRLQKLILILYSNRSPDTELQNVFYRDYDLSTTENDLENPKHHQII